MGGKNVKKPNISLYLFSTGDLAAKPGHIMGDHKLLLSMSSPLGILP